MPLVLIYLVIKLALLALSVGVGFLLHWLMPSVELGMGILIGVIATACSVHFFIRLMTAVSETEDGEVVLSAEPDFSLAHMPMRLRRKRKRRS